MTIDRARANGHSFGRKFGSYETRTPAPRAASIAANTASQALVLIAWLMYSQDWHWLPAVLAGLAVALVIGLYQGWLTAVLGVPSFVVTLGGLMSFRGAAFLVADGKTQPITDASFLLFGGGLDGSLGPVASWLLGLAGAAAIAWRRWAQRRARIAHGAAPQPLAWDLALGRHPSLVLHDPDGNHSAPAGAFLAAVVIAATLTGAAPGDFAVVEGFGVDAQAQARLRAVAAEAVLAYQPRAHCPGDAPVR